MNRVLVTGAGGPAGIAVIRSLMKQKNVTIFVADMNFWASGLYLLPKQNRKIVPAGANKNFFATIFNICETQKIDTIFSTVDSELLVLAKRRDELTKIGTVLAASSVESLEICLDKYILAKTCEKHVNVPTTKLLNVSGTTHNWDFPVIVKPRKGSGSLGVKLVKNRLELESLGIDETQIIQENLPGQEFSVDVLSNLNGEVLAAVPRSRELIDSGVSIAGRTINNKSLINLATNIVQKVGLSTVANVQLRYDKNGKPALLEVNPRFSGAMPLTIAAGVDMPALLHKIMLKETVEKNISFQEIANVRYLEDIFMPTTEIFSQKTVN